MSPLLQCPCGDRLARAPRLPWWVGGVQRGKEGRRRCGHGAGSERGTAVGCVGLIGLRGSRWVARQAGPRGEAGVGAEADAAGGGPAGGGVPALRGGAWAAPRGFAPSLTPHPHSTPSLYPCPAHLAPPLSNSAPSLTLPRPPQESTTARCSSACSPTAATSLPSGPPATSTPTRWVVTSPDGDAGGGPGPLEVTS